MGLPGWCPCIDCTAATASTTLDSTVTTISDDEPNEVAGRNSDQINRRPLSLNQRRKRVPSDLECSEDSTAGKDSKKPQKIVPEERFSFSIGEDDLESFKKGECPANTTKSTEWGMKNFESWRVARNAKFGEQCPERWFEDKENLCGWLCRFVAETRKADGGEYTPRSIYLLLAGLQRKIRQGNPKESINIFTDAKFKELQNVCDSVFKRLHQKGVGSETKSTPVLTQLEEDKLWESGVLDLNTTTGLLRAVFFYNGKSFCLCGGQEQRGLKLSQITKSVESVGGADVSCYTYREFGSKNRQGGFSSLNSDNKVVKQCENISGNGPCHVKILDIYLSKLPKKAKENDIFYLTPLLKKPLDDTKPWYTLTPVGKNKRNVC